MDGINEKRQKIAAAEARIARLKAEINKQERAADTRRKILIGSFVMAATNLEPKEIIRLKLNGKRLDEYLNKPADRHLFGLASEIKTVGDMLRS